ncbi:MAG TPA: putative zinc-binding protein [Negativicutes bacterium]|nr:putative zinc-binding protein [Negativicutes bacterium]
MSCQCCESKPQGAQRIVYGCAGCADVGEVADAVSRKLRRDGFATSKASCITGIGAGLQPFIDAAKAAGAVITIDGCETACAKKVIQNVGIEPQAFFLTKMGLEKGKTTPSPELTEKLCGEIVSRF